MSNKKNRSGTSQDNKVLAALRPDYVSVEERSIADLLMYARAYAQKVNFYNTENQLSGSWASFLNFTDDQILELAQFVADPDLFRDDSVRLEQYSKPHLALLLTFLKLLQYPKEQFAALTEKNVAYFYENILQLEKQEEIPDQVHVIFTLARDVKEHLLAEGTLVKAGKDNTGADLHYQVADDVVLNQAAVAAVKTIHLTKTATNLKYVHQSHNQGDTGFEKMVCLALGNLAQLPPYQTASGQTVAVDAAYLRTALYQRIKGKEKDELLPSDAAYILDSLCFRSLKDFRVCLNLLYREINRGYSGVTYPEDPEWEAAYTILAEVHRERLARIRRAELKRLHRETGFDAMMEYAFGEPEPGNMLYKMPGAIKTLAELAANANEASRQYIEHKLCMTVADFETIMAKKETALTSVAGEEVYALLEAAWTRKRGYRYPELGMELIDGFYADTVFDAATDQAVERFAAFGAKSGAAASSNIELGFAVSSPLLDLAEGDRQIEMVVSCKAGTIDHEAIDTLMSQSGEIFTTALSTAQGWQEARDVTFEHGKFIIKPAVKTYDRNDCALVCDITRYDLNSSHKGKLIGFSGGPVYEIVDVTENQMRLRSTWLKQTAGKTQLIAKLTPKTFVAELKATLKIPPEALRFKSNAEIFDSNFKGKYLVDGGGNVFLMHRFIDATEAEVRYCGAIPPESNEAAPLWLNKVWESIDFQIDDRVDLEGLTITGIYAAEQECTFSVTDAALKITYPEGTTAQQLLAAWKAWLNQPGNDPGRYRITGNGSAAALLAESTQELAITGEVLKRYESLTDNGLRVTYQGRPSDPANLIINAPSETSDTAAFQVSGGTLTITPGKVDQSANQVAAAWRLWLENTQNDPQGFQLESKDPHCWEAVPAAEVALSPLKQQVKKCELTNLYGVGIRVWYTGPAADQPRLILEENAVDLFEFAVGAGPKLTVKYPAASDTSAHDLVEAWDEWRASPVNDPGNFRLEALGDGFWKVQARTEKELQAAEGQTLECQIQKASGYDAGIIARYNLSGNYQNAIVELVPNSKSEFSFDITDVDDPTHDNVKTKKLTIACPPFHGSSDEDRIRQVQNLLAKWNRVYNKQGFSLVRTKDDAKWSLELAAPLTFNFLTDLSYVATVDPDGFIVKFRPEALKEGSPFTRLPRAKVILTENTGNNFAFQLLNDYPNNLKLLYLYYPNVKANRTVDQLLKAWEKPSPATVAELSEFNLVSAGTGKWEITATAEVALTHEKTTDTAYTDLINYEFYQYQTRDVKGFNLNWAGPHGKTPRVTLEEHEQDEFAIELIFSEDAFSHVKTGEKLKIKYPKRSDKRRLVDLLTAWQRFKNQQGTADNQIIGFELVDTSLVLEPRAQDALLPTGDRVSMANAGGGNGLSFSYIGHRDDPTVILEPIEDFGESVKGQKILWDNGAIFTVTERLTRNLVTVAATTEQIAVYDGVQLYEADALGLEALKFTIRLDADFPAVAPSTAAIASDPAVKILLKQTTATGDADSVAVFYDCFHSLELERINLNVAVQGLTDIKMRGNIAMINPDNPFAPFGQAPERAARFYFAHPEVCGKKLNSLTLNVNWAESQYLTAAGLPDLASYYYAYSHMGKENIGTIKNGDFEVNLQFLDQRAWVKLSEAPQALFGPAWKFGDLSKQTYQGELFAADQTLPKDPLEWPRYYKLELANQNFLADAYAELFSEQVRATRNSEVAQNSYETIKAEIRSRDEQVKAAKLAEAQARANGDEYYQPVIAKARELPSLPENDREIGQLTLNAPYTPVIQSLSIDYTAAAQLGFNTMTRTAGHPVKVYRLHPFGYETVEPSDTAVEHLLPEYDQTGCLFIGIENVTPPQTVSLLFQMIAGSGDASVTAPEISWSYLANNQWVAFKTAEILQDRTYGLQNTGIIRFAIPEAATMGNTILPGNCCWIRATAAANLEAVPDILDIRAQAVSVTYVNQGNDPEHLATPLPVGQITELDTREAEVKEIKQPYTSFGGKRQETSANFYARVSERLKHKNRALTLDDYEKLVLNQFPQIYKVKCIPQEELDSFEPESKGTVVVIVILKNANAAPFFPLKPKTPANVLEEIAAYLQTLMPPAVEVIVRNPRFEEVTYRLAVKFTDGVDRGYSLNRLNDAINRFLSPWAYEQDAAINFGSSVYSAALINYLESQPYVDYIANFNPLRQTIKHATYTEVLPLFLADDNAVTAKYPDSILVSAANHVIDVITSEFYDPSAFQGIGYMKIESDFWLARPGAIFSVGVGEMEIEAWPVMRYAFAALPVTVDVTARVAGKEYQNPKLSTQFSRADSQLIWNALKQAGYLNASGNVITQKDLYANDFSLFDAAGKFDEYLKKHLGEFTFQIAASDFETTAGSQTEFSYKVSSLDCAGLETAVVNLLKDGVGFDGMSQYPLIVY